MTHAPSAVDPGPPPARDCTLLAPAIQRIIADEIAEIRRTRPKDVAPAAEAEATATGALLIKVLPERCAADQWSGAYTACVDQAHTRDDARACQIHLDDAEVAALTEAIRGGTVAAGTLGIPDCDQWESVTLGLAQCQKFPAESRAALEQGVKQTMDAWRQSLTDPASRAAIESACKSAKDSIIQSATSLGCMP